MRKIIACIVAILAGVGGVTASDRLELPKVTLGSDGLMLRNWLVLGPFEGGAEETAAGADFLSTLGRPVENCTAIDLLDIAHHLRASSPTKGPTVRLTAGADVVDFGKLHEAQSSAKHGLPSTATYVACEIMAEADREAWLLFGSDDGAEIWLNGERCFFWAGNRAMVTYDNAVRLSLRRGTNLLLIKVSNQAGGWMMTARLEPDIEAATRTALSVSQSYLKRIMIAPGALLQLAVPGLPEVASVEARLETYDGSTVRHLLMGADRTVAAPDLPAGLYRIAFGTDGELGRQGIYLGKLDEVHAEMTRRCADIGTESRVSINVGTLLRRLKVLQSTPLPAPEKDERARQAFVEDLEYKAVYTAMGIQDIIDRTNAGEEAIRHRSGLHIRGFRSRVDDQEFHYRLFVPSSYSLDSPGLPLVVVLPPVFSAPRPYIESIYLSMHYEAERWSQIAEKLGVGVLWPGYRTCPYGNPTDASYLAEVMATVAGDYHLDLTRLYLYGFCSAGMTAAMEAVNQPDRFAAVAFLNPVLHRVKNRFDDNGAFDAFPVYQRWLRETDPVTALAHARDLPIWLIHDGFDPGHGPLAHSVDFVAEARAVGNNPRFDRNKSPPPGRYVLVEQQLAWLARQQRKQVAALDFSTTVAGRGGPLSRLFAERFIVVEGSDGFEDDEEALRKLSMDFQTAWRATNFVPCRVISDKLLDPEEERESNLVLVGNGRTNRVWRRIYGSLPITITESHVTIDGREYSGKRLAVQAWFPHPTEPGRKVMLLGGEVLAAEMFGTLELNLDGWFDFSIWETADGVPRLIAADRFVR